MATTPTVGCAIFAAMTVFQDASPGDVYSGTIVARRTGRRRCRRARSAARGRACAATAGWPAVPLTGLPRRATDGRAARGATHGLAPGAGRWRAAAAGCPPRSARCPRRRSWLARAASGTAGWRAAPGATRWRAARGASSLARCPRRRSLARCPRRRSLAGPCCHRRFGPPRRCLAGPRCHWRAGRRPRSRRLSRRPGRENRPNRSGQRRPGKTRQNKRPRRARRFRRDLLAFS